MFSSGKHYLTGSIQLDKMVLPFAFAVIQYAKHNGQYNIKVAFVFKKMFEYGNVNSNKERKYRQNEPII
jgi:hypothetical protein